MSTMELPREVEDYIKESIEDAIGLSVSKHTLELKLRATEADFRILRDQNLYLQLKLNEKDDAIERARAEANMNAQAVKKFIEENQKLAAECANLLSQCTRWEKECSLYDQDREALMDFANEADERAKDAEIHVHELEKELRSKESQFHKDQCEMQTVDYSGEGLFAEQILLEALLTYLVGNDETATSAHAFLETNSGVDLCNRLLEMWNSLKLSTRKILTLIAELKNVEKDKEHLRVNLARAEEEVNALFEENKLLDKENKRLLRSHEKDRRLSGSGEKLKSGASSNKASRRKSSLKPCSPIERKIDFIDVDSPRKPLSSLQHNSPEARVHNK